MRHPAHATPSRFPKDPQTARSERVACGSDVSTHLSAYALRFAAYLLGLVLRAAMLYDELGYA